jgi:hypothetical protein
LLEVALPWLRDPSPRLRHTSLLALAARAGEAGFTGAYGLDVLERLEGLQADPDPEVKGGLAAVLIALAQAGLAEAVLDRLECWAGEREPSDWVISQVLSAAWAAEHPARTEAILQRLEAQTGLTRYVTNTRRALERNRSQARQAGAEG